MSKPEDIPQDVWDAALVCIHDTVEQHQSGIAINQHTLDVMILAVARAILAERERCAGLLDKTVAKSARKFRDYHGDLSLDEIKRARITLRVHAAAIRKPEKGYV